MYTGKWEDVGKFMAKVTALMKKLEAGEDVAPADFKAILGETPEDLERAEHLLGMLMIAAKHIGINATYKARALLD